MTGGILVIGLRYGRGGGDGRPAAELTYGKTTELMDRFARKHGTFICRKLLDGCDLATEEGRKQFKDNDLANKICAPCVQTVADILEEILSEARS